MPRINTARVAKHREQNFHSLRRSLSIIH